jgi:hypothetical protein
MAMLLPIVREPQVRRQFRSLVRKPIPNATFMSFMNSIPNGLTFTRSTPATDFNPLGDFETSGNNIPRFDYNQLTLDPLGYLAGGSRINSLPWNNASGAVVGVPGSAPSGWAFNAAGGLSREIVGFGTVKGMPYVDVRWFGTTSVLTGIGMRFNGNNPTIVAASGQQWNASCYCAVVGGSLSNITDFRIGVQEYQSPSTVLQQSITNILGSLDGTLRRFSVNRVFSDALTDRANMALDFTFNAGVSIDITLRIALPQLEQGAFTSSVIVTSGAADTRANDICTTNNLLGAIPNFNPNEGTFIVEYEYQGIGSTQNQWVLQLDDGSINNRIYLATPSANTRWFSVVGGVAQPTISINASPQPNTRYRTAFAYANNNCAASQNGGAVILGPSVTIPTGLTNIRIGNNNSNIAPMFGYIREIIYIPRRVADSALPGLSRL